MPDGTVGVAQAASPDRLIDNEVTTNDLGQTVYRQKVAVPGVATDATLTAVLAAVDGLETLVTTLRDTVLRRTDPLAAGTANIGTVELSAAALAALEDTISKDLITHYASAAGGRLAFNITTGLVTFTTNGEAPLAALVNPAGSGKDIYLDLGEFGCSLNTTFRRYRGATITPTGSPISGVNMGGGSATSVAEMYVGGAGGAPATTPTYTATGGTVAKTAHIRTFETYKTEIKGKVVLRPGQNLSWTITQTTNVTIANPSTAAVFFEYWELPAAA